MLDFCTICKKCADNCPSHSIPAGDREPIDGGLRWAIDADSCFRYWNAIGTDCGRCMTVCPYSHPDNAAHNLVRWADPALGSGPPGDAVDGRPVLRPQAAYPAAAGRDRSALSKQRLIHVVQRADDVAPAAGQFDLARTVVAPTGQSAAHTQRRHGVEVVDLVVDEGQSRRRAGRAVSESRAGGRPCSFPSPCRRGVRGKEVAQVVAAQHRLHRSPVLGGGDGVAHRLRPTGGGERAGPGRDASIRSSAAGHPGRAAGEPRRSAGGTDRARRFPVAGTRCRRPPGPPAGCPPRGRQGRRSSPRRGFPAASVRERRPAARPGPIHAGRSGAAVPDRPGGDGEDLVQAVRDHAVEVENKRLHAFNGSR